MEDKITIKQLRGLLGMTQIEAAEFLGMTEQTYRAKENGRAKFSFTDVQKLCDLAKWSMDNIKINA